MIFIDKHYIYIRQQYKKNKYTGSEDKIETKT